MLSPTNAPVWGIGCSGVAVARTRRSIASGAEARALDRIPCPRWWPATRSSRPAAAMRRSRIPVRSTIQASVVSTRASRSALVSTRSGERGAPARDAARRPAALTGRSRQRRDRRNVFRSGEPGDGHVGQRALRQRREHRPVADLDQRSRAEPGERELGLAPADRHRDVAGRAESPVVADGCARGRRRWRPPARPRFPAPCPRAPARVPSRRPASVECGTHRRRSAASPCGPRGPWPRRCPRRALRVFRR